MCVVGRLRIVEFSETRPAPASPVKAHANTIAESNTLLFTVPSPHSTARSNGATSFLNCQKIRARFSITCGQQCRRKPHRIIGEIAERHLRAHHERAFASRPGRMRVVRRLQFMCGPGPPAASSTAARHSRLTGRIGGIGAVSGTSVGAAIATMRFDSVLEALRMNVL